MIECSNYSFDNVPKEPHSEQLPKDVSVKGRGAEVESTGETYASVRKYYIADQDSFSPCSTGAQPMLSPCSGNDQHFATLTATCMRDSRLEQILRMPSSRTDTCRVVGVQGRRTVHRCHQPSGHRKRTFCKRNRRQRAVQRERHFYESTYSDKSTSMLREQSCFIFKRVAGPQATTFGARWVGKT